MAQELDETTFREWMEYFRLEPWDIQLPIARQSALIADGIQAVMCALLKLPESVRKTLPVPKVSDFIVRQ